MWAFLGSVSFLAWIALYGWGAIMFGRASWQAGNGLWRAVWDAATWPVFGWPAIEKLAKNPPV